MRSDPSTVGVDLQEVEAMSKNSEPNEPDFRNGEDLDRKIKQAVREALAEHKRKRQRVAAWDGKAVVIVRPEDIPPKGAGPQG